MSKLLHWWRLLTEPLGSDGLFDSVSRRWRVNYGDGKFTRPMDYDCACSFAKQFGGTIERVKHERT